MADNKDIRIRVKIEPDRGGASEAKRSLADIGREALRSGKPLASLSAGLQSIQPSGLAAAAGIGAVISVAAGGLAVVRALSQVVQALAVNFADAARRGQDLRTQLVTVAGGVGEANAVFRDLKQFASNTPFEIDKITEAYIRLRAVGIDPTASDLEALGNIAAANSKDITQAAEAAVGAITGEMDRLKAFGITVRQEGDQVRFVFDGVETEVDRSAGAIFDHLTKIGSVDFAGGMERQSKTASGALSNLSDAAFNAFESISSGTGILAPFASIVQSISERINGAIPAATEYATALVDEVLSATESVAIATAALLDKLDALGVSFERKARLLARFAGAQYEGFFLALRAGLDALGDIEGTGARESATREFFAGLRQDLEDARAAAAQTGRGLAEARDRTDELAARVAALRARLKETTEAIREHESGIRTSEAAITAARAEYAELADAIEGLGDALDGLDSMDTTAWLESQGIALPETAQGWRDLSDAIMEVEAALGRLDAGRGGLALDVEGALGGSVSNAALGVDPSILEKLEREHAETYGAMAKEAEAVMARAWENIQDIVADSVAQILRDGEISWRDLADSLLDIFAQMLAQLLVMWAANAAKRIAMEQAVSASVGDGASAGGVGGSGVSLGWMKSIGKWIGSNWLAVVGTAALVAAAGYIAYQWIDSNRSRRFVRVGSIRYQGDGEFDGDINSHTQPFIDAIRAFVTDFETITGGFVESLPQIAIDLQNNSNQIRVTVEGIAVGYFESMEEAIEFGMLRALEGARISDLSEVWAPFVEALQDSAFRSLEDVMEAAQLFASLERDALDPTTASIRDMQAEWDVLRRKMDEFGINADAVLGQKVARDWQTLRDSITGTTKSARELAEERRQAFNEEVRREEELLKLALEQAEGQAAAAAAQIATLQTLVAAGAGTAEMLARWTAQLDIAEDALRAAERAAAAARGALDALPDLIGEGELHGGGTGRRGRRRADRERLADMLREHDLSKLTDFQRELVRINDKWDEAIKLAHGNADAIDAVNRAREEEIRQLTLDRVDSFYQGLRQFERGDRSPLASALAGVTDEAARLAAEAREVAEALGWSAERVERILGRIRDAAQEQRQGILDSGAQDLLLDALTFLGRGEDSERIRFEIQKAQLLIAYEELKVAAEKYKIEVSLLQEIGGLVGDIKDLDFETWRGLQAPVAQVYRTVRDTAHEAGNLADRLMRAKESIVDFINALDRNEFGGLSPREALESSRAQYEEILAAARTGDIGALEALPGVASDFLRIAREFYASGPQFAEIFAAVRAASIDLLGVSRVHEGNAVFDERFYQQQQQQTDYQRRMVELLEENNNLRRQEAANRHRGHDRRRTA